MDESGENDAVEKSDTLFFPVPGSSLSCCLFQDVSR